MNIKDFELSIIMLGGRVVRREERERGLLMRFMIPKSEGRDLIVRLGYLGVNPITGIIVGRELIKKKHDVYANALIEINKQLSK